MDPLTDPRMDPRMDPRTDKVLNQLVEKLRKIYGERLVSVVLYGSAVVDECHPTFSDFNVLCVLSEITPRELAAVEETFRWWREQGSPSPLLLTEREMADSTRSFAIEFHDIKCQHRLLAGKDVVTPLELDDSFYRAQVEHDLRAKLLRLRQKACGMLSDTSLLRRLLLDSVSTFCVLFRHALVLHGVDPPAGKRAVIERARELFGIDAQPFQRLLDVRERRIQPGGVEPVRLLASYLESIALVIGAVSRLQKAALEKLQQTAFEQAGPERQVNPR